MFFEKKCKKEYFVRVYAGEKNFELRLDEDGIAPGDYLTLNEWEEGAYTGRKIKRLVRYVLRNCPEYGLKEGYCIIGF